jgi:hypothetical protein
MECSACGRTLPNDSVFCMYCGVRVSPARSANRKARPLLEMWRSPDFHEFYDVLIRSYENPAPRLQSEEAAYLAILQELAGMPILEKAEHAEAIVLFLNRWHCRLSAQRTPTVLHDWINVEAPALERLAALSLDDPTMRRFWREYDTLYDSVLGLQKAGVHSMGPAAASRILHLMIPALFVMWDKEIARLAGVSYGRFQLQMHDFATCLEAQFGAAHATEDMEAYLRTRLHNPTLKPLARLLDEFNWCTVFHIPDATL